LNIVGLKVKIILNYAGFILMAGQGFIVEIRPSSLTPLAGCFSSKPGQWLSCKVFMPVTSKVKLPALA